MADEVKITQKQ